MKTKNKIILMTIGLITSLLMIVAGLTYAWFILVVDTPDEDTNSIIVKSADLGKTIFYNGDTISINGAYPGWCETKKVSVVSENSTVLKKYYLYLNVVTNELKTLGSKYGYVTMKSTVVTDETTVTSGSTGSADLQNITYTSGKLLILSGEIGSNDKHTYNIEFCFPELSANQNSQQGKVFNSYLSVEGEKEKCETAFCADSWETIATNIKNGDTSSYKVGDTKEVTLDGGYGRRTLRIANMSIPDECNTEGFSQTACGFVVEFTDIIAEYNMNPAGTYNGTNYSKGTNIGGWPASLMYKFINGTDETTYSAYITDSSTKSSVKSIYMSLPEDLRNVITDTYTVSGHGSTTGETNFTSTDKLYLLSTAEVLAQGTSNTINYDTARDVTRQLDYYSNQKVTTDSYSAAIKQYNGSEEFWWLRSANSYTATGFYTVSSSGDWKKYVARSTLGVSPAFRIG
jgi:hypothetical protein